MAEIRPEKIDPTLMGKNTMTKTQEQVQEKRDRDQDASALPKGVVLDKEGKPYAYSPILYLETGFGSLICM